MYSEQYKEKFYEEIKNIIDLHLNQNIGFKLALKNNTNWVPALPIEIQEKFKEFIPIEISGWALEHTCIEGEELHLRVAFGENDFENSFEMKDVIGIISLQGAPILLTPFTAEKEENNMKEENSIEGTKERSLNMFKRNNKI